jgi:hypothetical protein
MSAKITSEFTTIHLKPGDSIICFLYPNKNDKDYCATVEARVTDDGKCQMFYFGDIEDCTKEESV